MRADKFLIDLQPTLHSPHALFTHRKGTAHSTHTAFSLAPLPCPCRLPEHGPDLIPYLSDGARCRRALAIQLPR